MVLPPKKGKEEGGQMIGEGCLTQAFPVLRRAALPPSRRGGGKGE